MSKDRDKPTKKIISRTKDEGVCRLCGAPSRWVVKIRIEAILYSYMLTVCKECVRKTGPEIHAECEPIRSWR